MFCTACGNEIEETARFCHVCGATVDADDSGVTGISTAASDGQEVSKTDEATTVAPSAGERAAYVAPGDPVGKRGGRGRLIPIVIVAAGVIIAAAIIFAMLFSNGGKPQGGYAVPLVIRAQAYNPQTDTEIPLQVDGSDSDGNQVHRVTYVGHGADLTLDPGSYVVTVPASPLTADGRLYKTDDVRIELTVADDGAVTSSAPGGADAGSPSSGGAPAGPGSDEAARPGSASSGETGTDTGSASSGDTAAGSGSDAAAGSEGGLVIDLPEATGKDKSEEAIQRAREYAEQSDATEEQVDELVSVTVPAAAYSFETVVADEHNLDFVYPVFYGPEGDATIESLNERVKADFDEHFAWRTDETTDWYNSKLDHLYYAEYRVGVTFFQDGLAAIQASDYQIFPGAAHGMPTMSCQVVDLETGAEVSPLDVVGISAGQRDSYIRDAMGAFLRAHPSDLHFTDVGKVLEYDSISEQLDKGMMTLVPVPEGLALWAAPYVLGSFAYGSHAFLVCDLDGNPVADGREYEFTILPDGEME